MAKPYPPNYPWMTSLLHQRHRSQSISRRRRSVPLTITGRQSNRHNSRRLPPRRSGTPSSNHRRRPWPTISNGSQRRYNASQAHPRPLRTRPQPHLQRQHKRRLQFLPSRRQTISRPRHQRHTHWRSQLTARKPALLLPTALLRNGMFVVSPRLLLRV